MADTSTFDPSTQDPRASTDGYEESVGVPFPVVGIGASAGGLEAFTALFRALPADTGMAFVVVQHMSPERPSSLAEILSRSTKLPVAEAHDEPTILPDHVYIMPADRNVEVSGGALRLLPRDEGRQHPIDRLFRSLAESQKHLSIGVVLSGTATDGTQGLQAIHSHGGITFAQDDTATHGGMPHSAIASGSVDFILPPEEIAKEIARIGRDPQSSLKSGLPDPEGGAALVPVLKVLHQATGVDFSSYKANTLHRRIRRRMILQGIDELPRYVDVLRQTPAEVESLYQDILISVTSFFRDPEGYEALKAAAFSRLIANRSPDEPLRVWSLGCSTGEEAYSLCIALEEFFDAAGVRVPLQLFATDLNSRAIETARAGVYSKDIGRDVSPERLRRFFTEVPGGYRIKKSIREACVFSKHNVLKDPPFSRLDLISCRNLLIYIEQVLQERIVPVLHYALKPGGFLWLGGSETIGRHRDLFDTVDARHRVYSKKPGTDRHPALVSTRGPGAEAGPAPAFRRPAGPDLQQEADRVVLSRFAPPGVLVSADMNILQYRGSTGAYLAPAPGRATLNLLKMLREGLLAGVRAAFQEAEKQGTPTRRDGLRVRSSDGWRLVSVEVVPVGTLEGGERGFLVLFEEAAAPGARTRDVEAPAPPSPEAAEQEIARLTEELNTTRDYLQSVIEQLEASNEELQSANEEVQSANEELQSTNEELETSKEEIQSSNEELITLNEELGNVNRELARVNDDLVNVLDSVQMPILLLGPDLRVRRFTHAAERVLNLAPTDVGRPIGALKLHLEIPDLEAILTEVLETMGMREREVRDRDGHWLSLRVRPYRTTDDRIDGIVLTLVDIERLKRIQEYTDSIIGSLRGPILVLNENLHVRTANRSFYEVFGGSPGDVEGRPLFEIVGGQWDIPELRRLLQEVLPEDRRVEDFEVELDVERLGRRTILLNARTLIQPHGDHATPSILLAMEDITEPAKAKRALQENAVRLQESDRHKNEFLAMLAHELRNPLAPIQNAVRILRLTEGKGAETASALDLMERQIGQMVRFVDDLLDASRMNVGRIDLRRKPIDLSSAVNTAAEAVGPMIQDRNQVLTVTLPSPPLYVDGDPNRLAQAVGNLLHNASKFTDDGGTIRLTAEREGDQAVIRVRDSGIGIAAEQLPRIFDLFMQADTSLERTRTGLGIGLALVKVVAEKHGGTVEATSPGLGQGSEFVLRLPFSVEASTPSPVSGREPTVRKPKTGIPRRILVVDDSHDSAESLTTLLRLTGHEVSLAYDGEEALAAVASFRPEVVLLDIGMPKLNGHEVAHRIREHPWGRKMTLVAVSGWGQEEDRRKARESGFDAYLVKPVNYEMLIQVVAGAPPAKG